MYFIVKVGLVCIKVPENNSPTEVFGEEFENSKKNISDDCTVVLI